MNDELRELASLMGGAGPHEAEQLLAHVLGVSRARLLTRPPEPTAVQREQARALARRRGTGEPLQYILGWVPFLSARVHVGPGVLIPRPETELLTITALQAWQELDSPLPHTAIDVGTGSGCIALGLALAEPCLRVIALESSESALDWARRNIEANAAGAVVELYRSDLFSGLESLRFPERGASLIVSNPPYVTAGEWPGLSRDVREHEPREALVAGPTGFEVLERILDQAPRWLSAPGLLALEISPELAGRALSKAEAGGAFRRAEVRPDLAGRARMLFAWRK
ncbi:MAG TPA: peptide chain release factor N(5)-glutamine methyltransferase [Candidatus Saccharimonadales bacterium]|nr:peptide chain release factor N(5)-glutamine methyltransferase [Candidatus Saccharimonadales bacterium]